MNHESFLKLAGPASLVESLEGFEPSTRCLEGSRSVQLSYRDIVSHGDSTAKRTAKQVVERLSA